MVTEPLGKKRSLHMSQDIYLICTTVRRIHGEFCDLCKSKEKLGMCWSNDLLCFSHWLCRCMYPQFYQLSLESLSSPRPQYLSAVTFLKPFSHFCSKSVDGKWKMSEPNQLTASFVSLLAWIPGLFISQLGNMEGFLVNCLEDKL